jgi:hypothetical protein
MYQLFSWKQQLAQMNARMDDLASQSVTSSVTPRSWYSSSSRQVEEADDNEDKDVENTVGAFDFTELEVKLQALKLEALLAEHLTPEQLATDRETALKLAMLGQSRCDDPCDQDEKTNSDLSMADTKVKWKAEYGCLTEQALQAQDEEDTKKSLQDILGYFGLSPGLTEKQEEQQAEGAQTAAMNGYPESNVQDVQHDICREQDVDVASAGAEQDSQQASLHPAAVVPSDVLSYFGIHVDMLDEQARELTVTEHANDCSGKLHDHTEGQAQEFDLSQSDSDLSEGELRRHTDKSEQRFDLSLDDSDSSQGYVSPSESDAAQGDCLSEASDIPALPHSVLKRRGVKVEASAWILDSNPKALSLTTADSQVFAGNSASEYAVEPEPDTESTTDGATTPDYIEVCSGDAAEYQGEAETKDSTQGLKELLKCFGMPPPAAAAAVAEAADNVSCKPAPDDGPDHTSTASTFHEIDSAAFTNVGPASTPDGAHTGLLSVDTTAEKAGASSSEGVNFVGEPQHEEVDSGGEPQHEEVKYPLGDMEDHVADVLQFFGLSPRIPQSAGQQKSA